MIAKNEIVLVSKRPWKSEAYTPIYCAEAGRKEKKKNTCGVTMRNTATRIILILICVF